MSAGSGARLVAAVVLVVAVVLVALVDAAVLSGAALSRGSAQATVPAASVPAATKAARRREAGLRFMLTRCVLSVECCDAHNNSVHEVPLDWGVEPTGKKRRPKECDFPVPTTMLIAYDGSGEARRAITFAARLLAPRQVEVLTAWEPLHRTAARAGSMSGLHQAEWVTDSEDGDPAYVRARDTCNEGVELAESLGLAARAHLVEAKTSVWSAIVDAAQVLEPDVIVTGTRSASSWKSLWQPSTAEGVLHNAGIPVFIVPPEA